MDKDLHDWVGKFYDQSVSKWLLTIIGSGALSGQVLWAQWIIWRHITRPKPNPNRHMRSIIYCMPSAGLDNAPDPNIYSSSCRSSGTLLHHTHTRQHKHVISTCKHHAYTYSWREHNCMHPLSSIVHIQIYRATILYILSLTMDTWLQCTDCALHRHAVQALTCLKRL